MDDRPKDLNPSQWNVVKNQSQNLLIVAGPGTGKTHTITYRIAHLCDSLNSKNKILAITFTNKAAQEMRERLRIRIGQFIEKIYIGTFHSFCLELLQHYGDRADIPQGFRLAVEEEIMLSTEILWPKLKKKERMQKIGEISKLKNNMIQANVSRDVQQYNRWLRDNGLLDFDDLILESVNLLKKDHMILQEVRNVYKFVFVDEYQDINHIQHEFLKLIIGEQGSLTAIGDPNQAIYGFRGGDVGFFDSFKKDFLFGEVLSLEDNYRSAQNLLTAATQIISKNKSSFFTPLTANIYSQGRLVIHQTATEKGEAEYVVHQIEKIVGGTSMFSQDSGRVDSEDGAVHGFGEIAVLFRLNSQCVELKKAFDRSGIPYQITQKKNKENEEDVCPTRYEDVYLNSEKVSLMTLHAAKGLEFPVIFIIGCEERILPLNLPGLEADLQEERRLFYVGMTRAKHRLYLVCAKKRRMFGQTYQNSISRFVEDIEKDLREYEKIQIKEKKKKKEEDQFKLF
ncbi:MAG: ATP-dependent helicase [Candidatus Omnitrophica bacterium]|nr:ATP-dependent helicase [Candidatus Omnitrophota bacterium]